MILAADIGGTKSLFACLEIQDGQLTVLYKKKYPSRQFSSLEKALETFLEQAGSELGYLPAVKAACIAVAGTIIDSHGHLVNLGWTVDRKLLQKAFPAIPKIILINDLEAVGHAIPLLGEKDLLSLTPHLSKKGEVDSGQEEIKKAILAPGTGLGEALVLGERVFASEGGHCGFGPSTEEEVRLWRFLKGKFGHVSYERILSGPGFSLLAEFLMEEKGVEEIGFELLPEEITRRGLSGECEISRRALELFAAILGSEAGNLALKALALDGIYLGGGIPAKILPKLQDGAFLRAFYAKGRFAKLLKTVPVFVILNGEAALYGAAMLAAREIFPATELTLTVQDEQ